ncbi:hypothetical protein F383_25661 [Gossypium arboreum]|uniref:Uncharacterized protein n=1 Tax=Gossypium arboreum TaxID=29729 RepID=A0A0B0MS72_GOSAR|nr:hypothetical protein F383_25661 [Gossypium arboreum]
MASTSIYEPVVRPCLENGLGIVMRASVRPCLGHGIGANIREPV